MIKPIIYPLRIKNGLKMKELIYPFPYTKKKEDK